MTWGKLYWPYWIILTSLTFLVPELIALFSGNPQDTLSDYSRSELHVGTAFAGNIHTLAWWASLVLWVTFVAWITPHIWWAKLG